MTEVARWVREIVERRYGEAPFAVGDIVLHPSGRKVKIIAGCYWGKRGLSNSWEWREVRDDETLGRIEYGYGWTLKVLETEGDQLTVA